MFDWIGKKKNTKNAQHNIETLRLADIFRKVQSSVECESLLKNQDLIDKFGILESVCDLLDDVCNHMRAQGLGLEPNLLGRTVVKFVMSPNLVGAVSILFANKDSDFKERMSVADAARDQGDYGNAEYNYWLALQYFPYHPNCLVQYGHALKEQNKLPDALANYLDGSFFGASKFDVDAHILHVADRIGKLNKVEKILKARSVKNISSHGGAMVQGLTKHDIIILTKFLHGKTPSPDEIIERICDFDNRQQLIIKLIGENEFSHVHRDSLRLINETGWGEK
jgi:hypothetical protein